MALPVVLPARSATSDPVGRDGDLALPLDVAVEERVHDGGAARVGQDFAAQADQAARRDMELEAHAAGAVVHHLVHLALARAELLDHHAEEGFRAIDDQVLDRLLSLPSMVRVRISGLPTASS